jgi:hypothetical protein
LLLGIQLLCFCRPQLPDDAAARLLTRAAQQHSL